MIPIAELLSREPRKIFWIPIYDRTKMYAYTNEPVGAMSDDICKVVDAQYAADLKEALTQVVSANAVLMEALEKYAKKERWVGGLIVSQNGIDFRGPEFGLGHIEAEFALEKAKQIMGEK